MSDNGHYQRPGCFSLFSGIGGIDLAFEQAGFEIIGQVENDDFCQRVLRKHWPHVPKWGDVRKVRGSEVETRLRLRCGNPRAIDVVAGGFPCQPFSHAGERRGKGDDRYLWPEMLRLIRELRPRIVFIENVTGIITLALHEVLSDLESEAYTPLPPLVIPACAVSASHIRDRVWVVAYANTFRRSEPPPFATSSRDETRHPASCERGRRTEFYAPFSGGADVADSDRCGTGIFGEGVRDAPAGSGQSMGNTNRKRQQTRGRKNETRQFVPVHTGMVNSCRAGREKRDFASESGGAGYPAGGFDTGGGNEQAESSLGRADDGIPGWMDRGFPAFPGQPQKEWEAPRTITERVPKHAKRIAALGNAVVPQVVYPFAVAIREWLGGEYAAR